MKIDVTLRHLDGACFLRGLGTRPVSFINHASKSVMSIIEEWETGKRST
jgi:hypothetical protein